MLASLPPPLRRPHRGVVSSSVAAVLLGRGPRRVVVGQERLMLFSPARRFQPCNIRRILSPLRYRRDRWHAPSARVDTAPASANPAPVRPLFRAVNGEEVLVYRSPTTRCAARIGRSSPFPTIAVYARSEGNAGRIESRSPTRGHPTTRLPARTRRVTPRADRRALVSQPSALAVAVKLPAAARPLARKSRFSLSTAWWRLAATH